MKFEALQKIADQMTEGKIISYEDIPNIDLYVDQVTAFIDDYLESSKRTSDDKLLTKTMINNYTKDKVLPPPIKKKYTKKHILMMIMIHNMKSVMQLGDIKKIINKMEAGKSEEEIYKLFTKIQNDEYGALSDELGQKYKSLAQFGDEDKLLLLIISLIIESSAKKQLAERLIDKCFSRPSKPEA